MKYGCLVIGMRSILLCEIGQKISHIKTVFHKNFAVCAVGEDMPHDGLKTGDVFYPAAVPPVAPLSFVLLLCHPKILLK